MLVYKFRKDGVYLNETLEVVGPGWPEGTTPEVPPMVNDGQYLLYVMGKWEVVDGEVPTFVDEEQKLINKNKALLLLSESDWVEYPSVSEQTNTPHLLNISEWLSYRVDLRSIAVNPTDSKEVEFPVKPEEHWSSN